MQIKKKTNYVASCCRRNVQFSRSIRSLYLSTSVSFYRRLYNNEHVDGVGPADMWKVGRDFFFNSWFLNLRWQTALAWNVRASIHLLLPICCSGIARPPHADRRALLALRTLYIPTAPNEWQNISSKLGFNQKWRRPALGYVQPPSLPRCTIFFSKLFANHQRCHSRAPEHPREVGNSMPW